MRVWVDASPSELACVPEIGVPYCELLVDKTNNEAEYLAVIAALEHFPSVTEILSDSEVVVRQINTRLGCSDVPYSCKSPNLKILLDRVLSLFRTFEYGIRFSHTSRKQNKAGKLLG